MSTSNKTSNSLQLNASTIIEIGGTYIRKMAGVDFLVKLLGYIIRFKILSLSNAPTVDKVTLDFHKNILGSIVESRMLSNSGKSPGSWLSATKLAETPEDFGNPENNAKIPASCDCGWFPSSLACLTNASSVKLASYIALVCRTFEQVSSDAGYLSRYVFTTWNRDRLTLEYKRWKSLSLTCLLFVELSYLFRYLHQRMEKRRMQQEVASPLVSIGGGFDGSISTPMPSESNGEGSSLGSPAHGRSASVVQFEKARGVEEAHRVATPSSFKYKYRFQHMAAGTEITQADAINSGIVAVRSACDMYIYYRWLPSWNPPDFWQFSAGMVSAVLGIYLVLEETIGDVKKNHSSKPSTEMAKIVDARQQQKQ